MLLFCMCSYDCSFFHGSTQQAEPEQVKPLNHAYAVIPAPGQQLVV